MTYLPVDETGRISPEAVECAIREETCLVSIVYANNEIGTIQPITEIGKICRAHGVLFHTDAVQAADTLPIDVEEQCIDMLSISAHKFYRPKGIGAFYCKWGIYLPNLIESGAQERGHRAGTENVASIISMTKALELAYAESDEKMRASKRISLGKYNTMEECDRIIEAVHEVVKRNR